MRLFIAINFTDEIKKVLMSAVGELRNKTISGNFTREENLHLTLAFIGETNRTDDIIKILNDCEIRPFKLVVGGKDGCGVFRRPGGDIWWAAVRDNPPLKAVVKRLTSVLVDSGFDIDDREFKPHITLGREIVAQNRIVLDVPTLSMIVGRISIMKSERIGGRLIYSEVYGKQLFSDNQAVPQ